MTHRDRAGDPPGRRIVADDAGYRQDVPTHSGVPPRRSLWVYISAAWYKPGSMAVFVR